MRSLARVDFPQPDSPTIPRVSPLRSWKLTPSTALTSPTWRRTTTPWVSGKCLTSSSTSSTVSAAAKESALLIEDLLGVVARGVAAGGHLAQRGPLGHAQRRGVGAAWLELTPRRDVEQARRQALDGRELLALEVDPRDRLEQPLRVRVSRSGVDRVDRRLLHGAPGIHHDDVIGDVGHHPEDVGDEDEAHPALRLDRKSTRL